MLVPIHDENALKHIPFQYVTVGLIIANVVVFALFQSGLVLDIDKNTAALAIIPVELWTGGTFGGAVFDPNVLNVPEIYTPLTYMFLHGNLMHLLGNMLFLWVFGDNVEDSLGHMRFLLFYLLSGVFAGLAHTIMLPDSDLPLIGASGAVSGVIAAYLMLHPNVWVWVVAFRFLPLRLQAFWVIGAWILWQVANVVVTLEESVAWWAHIGGLIAGAVLVVIMRKPGTPLFDRVER